MAIEVVFEKRINNTAIRRDVDIEQRREYILLTFLAALFVLGLVFYGWQQYRWIQLGYEIESLEKQRSELMEYQNQLLLDANSLGRDERVELYARKKLGMVLPSAAQIVTLAPDLARPQFDITRDTPPLTAAKR